MRPYEIVMIFDADLEEGALAPVLERAQELIRQRGGEPGRVDHWGKRRFAFELKHRWEGVYVVLQARAEPSVMEELDRSLSLSDEVLRHRIVRVPEAVFGTPPGETTPTVPAEA